MRIERALPHVRGGEDKAFLQTSFFSNQCVQIEYDKMLITEITANCNKQPNKIRTYKFKILMKMRKNEEI